MSLSAYSTQFMTDTVLSLRSLNRSSVMLDLFFGLFVPPTGQEEVMFDVEDDALGIMPFVSPMREGKVLPMLGHTTKYFKPAYIKAKTPVNPYAVLKRAMGEQPGGKLSANAREQAIVARIIDDHLGRLSRSLELMAIDALIDGKNTVTGDGFDAVEVDYGRAAGHSVTITEGSQWDDNGISPVADLDTRLQTVAAACGVWPDVVVMDPKAWALYEADDKLAKRRDLTLAVLPGAETKIAPGASSLPVKGAKLVCSLDGGAVKIYVYQQQYKHPTTGTITNMIPDYSVFIGCSDRRCQGTRYFGTILDPKINYESGQMVDPATGLPLEFAVKEWTVEDPAQRLIMTQCAPLTALTRPNSTMYLLVKS